MSHSHPHTHSHGTEEVGDGVLLWTVIVNLGLSVFEFIAGIISGSVALMADALHNLTDAGASLAVLIGGAAIYWLDWTWVDPLISLGIAGYILWMSIGMIRRTSAILMEGSPPDFPFDELRDVVKALDGVADLHHLHVWELDEHHRALEAHIVLDSATEDSPAARRDLRQRVKDTLADSFDIVHSTLELETEEHPCDEREEGHP